jgi:ribosomal protein S18 acetylase RimI-like enzyme
VTDFTADSRLAADLLNRLERFYDAVPRKAARVEQCGPFSLFVRRGEGWPFYARPTLGLSGPVAAADVAAVRARQRELGVPETVEWVPETSPAVASACSAAGLAVRLCPLMVLSGRVLPPAAVPDGVTVDLVTVDLVAPEDSDLAAIEAVVEVGFGAAGDAAGTAERDTTAAHYSEARLDRHRQSLRGGDIVQVAARGLDGPLAVGSYQHAEGTAEIVGVATLPAARRRGLATQVTAGLAEHALGHGLGTVFLSAGNDAVARMYARVGFRRIGTAGLAEPPAS